MGRYLISARHLLGPDGGFAKDTAAKDVPAFVQSIDIHSFSGGLRHYEVTGLLVPTERLKPTGGEALDDMAVYLNHDTSEQSQAVVLADHLPAVHEKVWLVAHVRSGVPDGQILQTGIVDRLPSNGWIVIQFDNDQINPAGASGSPLLNAAGEVLGVYSGHNTYQGHIFGFVVPATLIGKIIQQAPAASSP